MAAVTFNDLPSQPSGPWQEFQGQRGAPTVGPWTDFQSTPPSSQRANVFDQFDAPQSSTSPANVFDQFDTPTQQQAAPAKGGALGLVANTQTPGKMLGPLVPMLSDDGGAVAYYKDAAGRLQPTDNTKHMIVDGKLYQRQDGERPATYGDIGNAALTAAKDLPVVGPMLRLPQASADFWSGKPGSTENMSNVLSGIALSGSVAGQPRMVDPATPNPAFPGRVSSSALSEAGVDPSLINQVRVLEKVQLAAKGSNKPYNAALRNKVQDTLLDDDKSAEFSPETKQALQDFVDGGPVTNAVASFGNRFGGHDWGVPAFVGLGVSHLPVVGPTAVGAVATGKLGAIGLRALANSRANTALEKIKTGIANEAPEASEASAGPTGPSIPLDPGVTGAGLMRALDTSPWEQTAPQPAAGPDQGQLLQQLDQFVAQTKARAQARNYAQQQMKLQATPLLRKLAAQNPQPTPGPTDADFYNAQQQNDRIDTAGNRTLATDATQLMAARRAMTTVQQGQSASAATPGAAVAPPEAATVTNGSTATVTPPGAVAGAVASPPTPPVIPSIIKKLNGDVNTTPQQQATPGLAEARASQLARKLSQSAGAGDNASPEASAGGGVSEVPVPDTLLHTKVSPADLQIAQQATDQLKQAAGPIPTLRATRYFNATAQRQARIRDRLMALSADPRFPSDDVDLGADLDKIRQVRSREALASHVADISAQTSPVVGNVIRSYFGPKWGKSIWNASPNQ